MILDANGLPASAEGWGFHSDSVVIEERGDHAVIHRMVDLEPVLQLNDEYRRMGNNGFSQKRNFRRIASVPIEFFSEHPETLFDDKALKKVLRGRPRFCGVSPGTF